MTVCHSSPLFKKQGPEANHRPCTDSTLSAGIVKTTFISGLKVRQFRMPFFFTRNHQPPLFTTHSRVQFVLHASVSWPGKAGPLRKIDPRHEQGFQFRAGVLHHRRGCLFLDRRQLALRRLVERSHHPFERPVCLLCFFVHPGPSVITPVTLERPCVPVG